MKRRIKMQMLTAALVAVAGLSILSLPGPALAAPPTVQTPASSAAQQGNKTSAKAMAMAAAKTHAQRKAAHDKMMANIKAHAAAPQAASAQRKAAHDQMMTKIKAAHAARVAAGTDKPLTRDQRRARFAQKMQKLHPHTQNAGASAAPATP